MKNKPFSFNFLSFLIILFLIAVFFWNGKLAQNNTEFISEPIHHLKEDYQTCKTIYEDIKTDIETFLEYFETFKEAITSLTSFQI